MTYTYISFYKMSTDIKEMVWRRWIYKDESICVVCCKNKINFRNFAMAQVIKGSDFSLENLRPCCSGCYSGITNCDFKNYLTEIYKSRNENPARIIAQY